MGCKPEIKNSSLREKVKYFTMLKYQALTQLISVYFLRRILIKLGSGLYLVVSDILASILTPSGALPLCILLVKLPLVRKLGKFAAPVVFQSQVPTDSYCG